MQASMDIDSTDPYQKRYFTVSVSSTDTPINYPDDFVRSRRIKYVHVIAAHLLVPGEEDNTFLRPTCYSFHATFVQDDIDVMNHFVCMFNQPLYQPKQFEQFNSVKDFKIWICDSMDGTIKPLSGGALIVLELMLEF